MSDDALLPYPFVPWDVITHNEITAFESALHGARDERDMQRFLEDHPLFLTQQISGGSGAWVIPQRRLGAEHVTDFLVALKASGGFVWHAVELESQHAKVFNRNGDPSATLNHALRQIRDWRSWLSRNRDYATRPLEQSGHGLIDIDPELEGLIIIGRDANVDQATTEQRRRLMHESRVKIETYDWLLSQAIERFERYRALEQQRRQTELPRAANEVVEWLNTSALSDFEVPGPVRSMYFSNIHRAEYEIDSVDNMLVPFSNYTQDIPPKYNDFLLKVRRILRQVASRPPSVNYDEMHDYITVVPSGVISSVQAEQINQAAKDSSIKYLLIANVYDV